MPTPNVVFNIILFLCFSPPPLSSCHLLIMVSLISTSHGISSLYVHTYTLLRSFFPTSCISEVSLHVYTWMQACVPNCSSIFPVSSKLQHFPTLILVAIFVFSLRMFHTQVGHSIVKLWELTPFDMRHIHVSSWLCNMCIQSIGGTQCWSCTRLTSWSIKTKCQHDPESCQNSNLCHVRL